MVIIDPFGLTKGGKGSNFNEEERRGDEIF